MFWLIYWSIFNFDLHPILQAQFDNNTATTHNIKFVHYFMAMTYMI